MSSVFWLIPQILLLSLLLFTAHVSCNRCITNYDEDSMIKIKYLTFHSLSTCIDIEVDSKCYELGKCYQLSSFFFVSDSPYYVKLEFVNGYYSYKIILYTDNYCENKFYEKGLEIGNCNPFATLSGNVSHEFFTPKEGHEYYRIYVRCKNYRFTIWGRNIPIYSPIVFVFISFGIFVCIGGVCCGVCWFHYCLGIWIYRCRKIAHLKNFRMRKRQYWRELEQREGTDIKFSISVNMEKEDSVAEEDVLEEGEEDSKSESSTKESSSPITSSESPGLCSKDKNEELEEGGEKSIYKIAEERISFESISSSGDKESSTEVEEPALALDEVPLPPEPHNALVHVPFQNDILEANIVSTSIDLVDIKTTTTTSAPSATSACSEDANFEGKSDEFELLEGPKPQEPLTLEDLGKGIQNRNPCCLFRDLLKSIFIVIGSAFMESLSLLLSLIMLTGALENNPEDAWWYSTVAMQTIFKGYMIVIVVIFVVVQFLFMFLSIGKHILHPFQVLIILAGLREWVFYRISVILICMFGVGFGFCLNGYSIWYDYIKFSDGSDFMNIINDMQITITLYFPLLLILLKIIRVLRNDDVGNISYSRKLWKLGYCEVFRFPNVLVGWFSFINIENVITENLFALILLHRRGFVDHRGLSKRSEFQHLPIPKFEKLSHKEQIFLYQFFFESVELKSIGDSMAYETPCAWSWIVQCCCLGCLAEQKEKYSFDLWKEEQERIRMEKE